MAETLQLNGRQVCRELYDAAQLCRTQDVMSFARAADNIADLFFQDNHEYVWLGGAATALCLAYHISDVYVVYEALKAQADLIEWGAGHDA